MTRKFQVKNYIYLGAYLHFRFGPPKNFAGNGSEILLTETKGMKGRTH